MLETSKDLFFVVLAFAILWLSFFLGWLLYYVIKTLRTFYRVVDKIATTVDKVDALVDDAKDKLKRSSTYLGLVLELAKDFLQSKKRKSAVQKAASRRGERKKGK